jgi:hypothetical protein
MDRIRDLSEEEAEAHTMAFLDPLLSDPAGSEPYWEAKAALEALLDAFSPQQRWVLVLETLMDEMRRACHRQDPVWMEDYAETLLQKTLADLRIVLRAELRLWADEASLCPSWYPDAWGMRKSRDG